MIDISAVSKKHSRPWFMTPKRKKFYENFKKQKQLPRILIHEVDETLESLAVKDTS